MKNYQNILLRRLREAGWELSEVDEDGIGWWADEHWYIRSTRAAWGIELVVNFLVDPQWAGPRKKGEGVWEISVTGSIPSGRLIAEMSIKGPFENRLVSLVQQLDDFRNTFDRKTPAQADEGRASE